GGEKARSTVAREHVLVEVAGHVGEGSSEREDACARARRGPATRGSVLTGPQRPRSRGRRALRSRQGPAGSRATGSATPFDLETTGARPVSPARGQPPSSSRARRRAGPRECVTRSGG